jgi:hypothetical protein
MSNYLPNYDKKRKILARREEHLLGLIKRGATSETLKTAAEQVRQSRLGVIKSLIANKPVEYRRDPEKLSRLRTKAEMLVAMPVESILGEFGVGSTEEDVAE